MWDYREEKWRDDESKERCEDTVLLALKMEEGATSQGKQGVPLYKLQMARKDFSSRVQNLNLSSEKQISDFYPLELQENTFVLLKCNLL